MEYGILKFYYAENMFCVSHYTAKFTTENNNQTFPITEEECVNKDKFKIRILNELTDKGWIVITQKENEYTLLNKN